MCRDAIAGPKQYFGLKPKAWRCALSDFPPHRRLRTAIVAHHGWPRVLLNRDALDILRSRTIQPMKMSGVNPVPGRRIAREADGSNHRGSQSKEPYPRTSGIDVGHGFNLQKKSSLN